MEAIVPEAINPDFGNAGQDTVFKPVTESPDPQGIVCHVIQGNLACLAERHNPGDIFGPCPAVSFLRSAMHKWCKLDPLSDNQGSDPLRSIELVPGYGHQADSVVPEIDRN